MIISIQVAYKTSRFKKIILIIKKKKEGFGSFLKKNLTTNFGI